MEGAAERDRAVHACMVGQGGAWQKRALHLHIGEGGVGRCRDVRSVGGADTERGGPGRARSPAVRQSSFGRRRGRARP